MYINSVCQTLRYVRHALGTRSTATAYGVCCAALGMLVALYSHTTIRRVAEWADDERLLNATQRTCERSSAVRASNRLPLVAGQHRQPRRALGHCGACPLPTVRCG